MVENISLREWDSSSVSEWQVLGEDEVYGKREVGGSR
jgi:hypothetical protein